MTARACVLAASLASAAALLSAPTPKPFAALGRVPRVPRCAVNLKPDDAAIADEKAATSSPPKVDVEPSRRGIAEMMNALQTLRPRRTHRCCLEQHSRGVSDATSPNGANEQRP